jgi:hypothetical protein
MKRRQDTPKEDGIMPEANGHGVELQEQQPVDAEAEAIEDIRNLASQVGSLRTAGIERVPDYGAAFEQRTHTLMLESIDKIAQQWIAELNHWRTATQTLEQMVVDQVTRVKDEITKLHLLGAQTMTEARRGQEISQRLTSELDAMMTEHIATH